MGARSLMTAGMFAVIQLGAWEFVSAQEPPPFGDEFGLGAEGIEEIEALPEFQVEVLVFAYNAFDPSEENFNRKPRPALLGSLQEVEEPEPVEAIDPFQRPFLPAGVPDLPEPALDSTEADDPAEPPTPGEAESEEPRSIAEQLIATLAVLEDEPESLDPIAPTTPTDRALGDFEGVSASVLRVSERDWSADDTYTVHFRTRSGAEGVLQSSAGAWARPSSARASSAPGGRSGSRATRCSLPMRAARVSSTSLRTCGCPRRFRPTPRCW